MIVSITSKISVTTRDDLADDREEEIKEEKTGKQRLSETGPVS